MTNCCEIELIVEQNDPVELEVVEPGGAELEVSEQIIVTYADLSPELKQAFLNLAEHIAYIDADGQDYYDALYAALYPPTELDYITAVYTQSGTVYDTDSLNSLKTDLVVTAHYDDSTTETVTSYTLSGTLEQSQVITDLLSGITWEDGVAYDASGNPLDRPTLTTSDYIPVVYGNTYSYKKTSSGTDAYGMTLYFYDNNKGWLSQNTDTGTLFNNEYVKTFTPPSGAAYVRCMAYLAYKADSKLLYDATPSTSSKSIGVSYGGKSADFNVSVTHAPVMYFGAIYGKGTTGGSVTFNQDESVKMVSTGNTQWGLCYSPYGNAAAFKTLGNTKGHTIRCKYNINWAATTESSHVSIAMHLVSSLTSYSATRLRYSQIIDKSADEDGYVDFVVPSSSSDWEGGSSAVADSNYLSFRTYMVSSTSGADVTVKLTFYDLGVLP